MSIEKQHLISDKALHVSHLIALFVITPGVFVLGEYYNINMILIIIGSVTPPVLCFIALSGRYVWSCW